MGTSLKFQLYLTVMLPFEIPIPIKPCVANSHLCGHNLLQLKWSQRSNERVNK